MFANKSISGGKKVTYGVAPGQYCEAKNGIGQAKHDSKGLEEADELVGDGVDPDDGDDEAGKCEGSVVGGRGGSGGESNDESQQEGNIESELPHLGKISDAYP